MAWEFKWPVLGVIIPCTIIASTAYGSHYFVLRHHLSFKEQMFYQFLVCMIWVSYCMAIFTDPGLPPRTYTPKPGEWKRYCKKCRLFKPPRAHHCSKCQKCVLQMDHHCPWTMNCVGNDNFSHFMKFLVWVMIGTSYLLLQFIYRIIEYYEMSSMPVYLLRKGELSAVIVFTLLDVFVLLTITLLFIRCAVNMAKGMTQIETWDWERIESQFYTRRFWKQVRSNYKRLHGKKLPQLSSWRNPNFQGLGEGGGDESDGNAEEMQVFSNQNESSALADVEGASHNCHENHGDNEGLELSHRRSNESESSVNEQIDEVATNFTIDDLIFPYDYGLLVNFRTTLGPLLFWMLPWVSTRCNGYDWKSSEDYEEYDQLNLPWPPDFGHGEIRASNQVFMERMHWQNDMGERLRDFGVDIDTEQEESLD